MGKQRTLGCRVVRSVLQCKSSRLSGGAVPFEGITSLWGWGFKDWTLPWESEAILVWGRQTGRGSSFEIWHMACANVWTFGLCKKSPRSRRKATSCFHHIFSLSLLLGSVPTTCCTLNHRYPHPPSHLNHKPPDLITFSGLLSLPNITLPVPFFPSPSSWFKTLSTWF